MPFVFFDYWNTINTLYNNGFHFSVSFISNQRFGLLSFLTQHCLCVVDCILYFTVSFHMCEWHVFLLFSKQH